MAPLDQLIFLANHGDHLPPRSKCTVIAFLLCKFMRLSLTVTPQNIYRLPKWPPMALKLDISHAVSQTATRGSRRHLHQNCLQAASRGPSSVSWHQSLACVECVSVDTSSSATGRRQWRSTGLQWCRIQWVLERPSHTGCRYWCPKWDHAPKVKGDHFGAVSCHLQA